MKKILVSLLVGGILLMPFSVLANNPQVYSIKQQFPIPFDWTTTIRTIQSVVETIQEQITSIFTAIDDLQLQIDTIELTPGPEGPPGPTLKVFDNEGTEIGYLLDWAENEYLYYIVNVFDTNMNRYIQINLGTGELFNITRFHFLRYESDDCTGPAFVITSHPYGPLLCDLPEDVCYAVESWDDIKYDFVQGSYYDFNDDTCKQGSSSGIAGVVHVVEKPQYQGPLKIGVQ